MVVPNTIENGVSSAGGPSVVPASFVVADDREDYPLTQIGLEDAIADLPAAGGDIYIGPGTLLVTSPIVLPNKPIVIHGSGDATILDLAGNAISLFVIPFETSAYGFRDFRVRGTSIAGQTIWEVTVAATTYDGAPITIENVNNDPGITGNRVEKIFVSAATAYSYVKFSKCHLFLPDLVTSMTFEGDGEPSYTDCYFYGASNRGGFAPLGAELYVTAEDSYFAIANGANVNGIRATGCNFFQGTVTVDGGQCILTACRFHSLGVARLVDLVTTVGAVTVSGCIFSGWTNEALRTATDGGAFTGNQDFRVTETGTANGNRYSNNTGFGGSTILGVASLVENENYRNVMTWGAVGDGVTDDSAAIQAAIASLPTLGGIVFFPPGDYLMSAAVNTSQKNIIFRGSGITATKITPAASISAIEVNEGFITVEDMTFVGDASLGQTMIEIVAGPPSTEKIFINRVFATNFDVIIDDTAFGYTYRITDSNLSTFGATSAFLLAGTAGRMDIHNSRIQGSGAGTTGYQCSGSDIISNGTFAFGNGTELSGCNVAITGGMTFALQCLISGCFLSGDVTADNDTKFSGCAFNNDLIADGDRIHVVGCNLDTFSSNGFNGHVLIGNWFEGVGNNVTLTDSDNCIVKGNTSCQVLEVGTSEGNAYDNISGSSTILGVNAIVEGTRRFNGTGNTADAYATLLTFTSLKGLLGVGTIKNTDGAADQMTVEEEAIDFFGTTHTKETVVDAANDYLLNPQTNLSATGGPPYSSYRVRVKSTSAGNPAPYSIQFAAQGAAGA